MYAQGHHKREVEGNLAQTEEKEAKRHQRQRLEQCSHTRAMGRGSRQKPEGQEQTLPETLAGTQPCCLLDFSLTGPAVRKSICGDLVPQP